MFSTLTESKQEHWKNQANTESDTALADWKHEMESEPSTDPVDRQWCVYFISCILATDLGIRCIQGLVRVAQPFLNLICKATGWKATLMAGGPEPAHDGRLNVIRYARHQSALYTGLNVYFSIHLGFTPGDIKMNFGHAERTRFKKYFIPTFGSFLQKCYCEFLFFLLKV
jgi:hypothetical protein